MEKYAYPTLTPAVVAREVTQKKNTSKENGSLGEMKNSEPVFSTLSPPSTFAEVSSRQEEPHATPRGETSVTLSPLLLNATCRAIQYAGDKTQNPAVRTQLFVLPNSQERGLPLLLQVNIISKIELVL